MTKLKIFSLWIRGALQAHWLLIATLSGLLLSGYILCPRPALAQQSPTALAQQLPGTEPLEMQGDIASELVAGVDRFLLQQLQQAPAKRAEAWPRPANEGDVGQQWEAAVQKRRDELARIIGLRDQRVKEPRLQLEREPHASGVYAEGANWIATRARWPVLSGVDASGLWVEPRRPIQTHFRAVVIPDAGQTPEQLVGLEPSDNDPHTEACLPVAAILAAAGGEVVVTTPVSRHREARNGRAVMTDQEFLYRSAFELGRHVLGYQVHEVLAAVDALNGLDRPNGSQDEAKRDGDGKASLPVVVVGWGEGGWVALHAAAVGPAIDAACVSGHFQAREQLWREPVHRNVQGLLENFGDAELAAMVAPRKLIIDAVPGPEVTIGGDGGAPGRLTGPAPAAAAQEFERTQKLLAPWRLEQHIQLIQPATTPTTALATCGPSLAALDACLRSAAAAVDGNGDSLAQVADKVTAEKAQLAGSLVAPETRRLEMLSKWDRFTQRVLEQAADERAVYWKDLKTDNLENFQKSVEPYRQAFRDDVIGHWSLPLSEMKPRSRLVIDEPKMVGYEVVLDVFPDVIAYGLLLLPRDLAAGEQRPCVVFQHGLEGRPQDCLAGGHTAYNGVASRLAEEGFVVFAPQNLYLFEDRFRTLQRKSNPLGKTLFSTIIPQHQQICRWLAAQPHIDAKRIAFYGLSYGGKSAMRIPPLVPEYCLSICSADFNDWVWKNASTSSRYSYVWTKEYEIFEFDLGSRFNYAEMAALIAPRPFMVERGHFDGVAPDERVGLEFAKVRHTYAAKLGLPDEVRIEWFAGPHMVHGQGTFAFLHEKLNWPAPKSR